MTIFANLAIAVTDLLQQGQPVADVVGRGFARPMATQHATAVTVVLRQADAQNLLGQQPLGNAGAIRDFDTTFTVECRARSVAQLHDEALDPLLSAVALRLGTVLNINGQNVYLDLQNIGFDYDSDADNCAVATLTYTAMHRSVNADLS